MGVRRGGGVGGNRKRGNRHTWSPDLSFFRESTRTLARDLWVEVIPVHFLAHLCNWDFISSNQGVAESNGVRTLLLVAVTSTASTPVPLLAEVSFVLFVPMAKDHNKVVAALALCVFRNPQELCQLFTFGFWVAIEATAAAPSFVPHGTGVGAWRGITRSGCVPVD